MCVPAPCTPCGNSLFAHVCLLVWELLLAAPSIALFNSTSEDATSRPGLSFFVYTGVVVAAGIIADVLRVAFGWCTQTTRRASELVIGLYGVAQLGVSVWSAVYAQLYISGLVNDRAVDGAPLTVGDYILYGLGAFASVALIIVPLLIACTVASVASESATRRHAAAPKQPDASPVAVASMPTAVAVDDSEAPLPA